MHLGLISAEFSDWIANERPPWASYRALISCRLIGLNKHLGVIPVVVG